MACTQRVTSKPGQARARRGMVDDLAFSVEATSAWAWVSTLVVDTSLAAITVRVDDTLRPAASVRVSKILRQTHTRACSITLLAHCVSSTGRRVAGVTRTFRRGNLLDNGTAVEGITSEPFVTGTHGMVFDDDTSGVDATGAWARVLALLVLTGQVAGALGVVGALRAAVGRTAHIRGEAGACGCVANQVTLGVGATRGGDTRVYANRRLPDFFLKALQKGIAD